MAWTQKEIDEVYAKVRRKAMLNQDFRKLLLSDPGKAIAQVAGVAIPAGLKIKVIENDPAYDMTFVIPDLVSGEMSDEDLEKAAGGTTVFMTITGPCAADVTNCPAATGMGK